MLPVQKLICIIGFVEGFTADKKQVVEQLACNNNAIAILLEETHCTNPDCKPFDLRVEMRSSHCWPSFVMWYESRKAMMLACCVCTKFIADALPDNSQSTCIDTPGSFRRAVYMFLVRNYEAYDANPTSVQVTHVFLIYLLFLLYVFLLYLFIGLLYIVHTTHVTSLYL